jgi:DNA-binding NtrC family response regulator
MRTKVKILVIDKEEIILKSIRKALTKDEKNDYDITTCTNALEGLKFIRSDKYDLVLVDLILPGMSGNELLRRIKNVYKEIPVIIMSGYSSFGPPKTDFKTTGGETFSDTFDILKKPFTTEELKSIIDKIFTKGQNNNV